MRGQATTRGWARGRSSGPSSDYGGAAPADEVEIALREVPRDAGGLTRRVRAMHRRTGLAVAIRRRHSRETAATVSRIKDVQAGQIQPFLLAFLERIPGVKVRES